MKKIFLIITLILLMNVSLASNASVYQGWKIDEQMKFNVAYMPQNNYLKYNKKHKQEKPLFKPAYDFDIKNIELKDFMDLGFDISERVPENKKFYIKLFNYPSCLSEKLLVQKFMNEFFLEYGYNYQPLNKFVLNKKNVAVKFSSIASKNELYTKKNPIPKFYTLKDNRFSDYFFSHVPFYSIYLEPTGNFSGKTNEELALWSSNGVRSFQEDLIAYYKQNFCLLDSVDKNNFYFLARSIDNKGITVIKVPKEVAVFGNWKNLPMPQNPNKIFLTSLLLVYSTEYKAVKTRNPAIISEIESKDFQSSFIKGKTTVLEIGSVVKIK